jgi:uncharacterized protein YdhG (YjbR/CyaY superfamily)
MATYLRQRPKTIKQNPGIKKTPRDVYTYIEAAPEEARARLVQLRRIIKTAAPGAHERISYGMPYYEYRGRLAYFRLAKAHIGLYIPTPVIAEHKNELKGYEAAGATLRLPLDEKLPVKLIQKLIKARVKKNETKK